MNTERTLDWPRDDSQVCLGEEEIVAKALGAGDEECASRSVKYFLKAV